MVSHPANLVLDIRCELGEGALWHRPVGRLYWVDIAGQKAHAYEPATGRTLTALVGQSVGTVVPTRRREVLIALQRQFALLDFERGRLTPFPAEPIEPATMRFNDGKCDPAGRFWVGSMALDETPGQGRLHCLYPDLHVETKLSGLTISNGLAWSADARTLYFIDSPTQTIDAFDFDSAAGTLTNRRVLRRFEAGGGTPDGMTIDANGRLWVALWDGGRVVQIDPANGATLAEVMVPARRVTSCAFGGPKLDTLYITTARVGLTDAQLASEPLSGGLFAASPGVSGVNAFEFAG
jgi:sugar lactone lactonase YvrE